MPPKTVYKYIMMERIVPHSRPCLGKEEEEIVREVISSRYIAQGKWVKRFEDRLAEFIGVKGSVACSSGTAALHLILKAMEIGEGDEVIIPTYVCSALLNAVRYVNAIPIFADSLPDSQNIDPTDIKKRLTPKTKAIIVPHLFGMPAEIEEILSFGIPVIEDCAQSLGAIWNGRRVGSFGYASIFSFYATKMICTGEGGMIASNSFDLLERVRDLREYDKKSTYKVRYNYKMTEIQAAMGIAQLSKVQNFIRKRREIANYYNESFKELPSIQLPIDCESNIYYRYILRVDENLENYITTLNKRGIECSKPIFLPLHRYFKMEGYPVSERLWKSSLSIPIFPCMEKDEKKKVVSEITDIFQKGDRN